VNLENCNPTFFLLLNKDNELKIYSSALIAAKPCYAPGVAIFFLYNINLLDLALGINRLCHVLGQYKWKLSRRKPNKSQADSERA